MTVWPYPDDAAHRRFHRADPPDVRLAYLVAQNLLSDDDIRYERIAIAVQNGVVILTGTTVTDDMKRAAGRIARNSAGVLDVCNLIQPRTPDADPLGDADSGDGCGLRITDDADEEHRFRAIVADFDHHANLEPVGHLRGLRRPVLIGVAVLTAVLWSAVLVSVIALGWQTTAVAGTVFALTLVLGHTIRRATRRWRSTHPPRHPQRN